MKILIIFPNNKTGGTEKVSSIYFKSLTKVGYKIKICAAFKTLNAYGIDNSTINSETLDLKKRNRFIRPLILYFYILKMRIFGFKIFLQGEYIASIACLLPFKVNIRITNNINAISKKKYFMKYLYINSLKRHNIIVPHEKLLNIDSLKGLKSMNILPNPFVREKKHNSKFLSNDKQTDNKILQFIAVGQLNFQKNHEFLIETFEKLNIPKGYKVNLDIFGSGVEEMNLRKKIANIGGSNTINLMGWSKSPWDQKKNYIGHLLCSRWEGYPNVVVESASYHIPTISIPIPPCTTSMIKENNIGLVSTNKTVGSYSELISDYIENYINGENYEFKFDQFIMIHDPLLLPMALK